MALPGMADDQPAGGPFRFDRGFGGAPAPQTPARGQPLSTCSGVRFRESVSTWHSSQTFCPA